MDEIKKAKVSRAKAEDKAESMFYRLGLNIQFNMTSLSKISEAAERVIMAGGTDAEAESAMSAAISQYRTN